MSKHKEALEALEKCDEWLDHRDMGVHFENAWAIHGKTITDALQAASWQPIEEWDDDNTFGNYVLVAWENGLVEEMHWAAVRDYKKPKHHAGLSLKYFMRMPAAPVDGGR